jgi:hypothetical protein
MTDPAPRPAQKSAPKSLQTDGRRLWKAVTSAYELPPDELIVLESASACVDLVARLAKAMEGQPLVVKGSMGQEREHPLLSEQLQQRALLNRLLGQLRLPDLEPSAAEQDRLHRSHQARQAAQSRWQTARARTTGTR